MKKVLCFSLALAMLLTLAACDTSGNGTATTASAAFSTPAAAVTDSDALSDFFGGETQAHLEALSGVITSFACAVQTYPEVLSSVPDENFGWTYLYDMIVYSGVTCDGVSSSRGGYTVTAEALQALQSNTLGGAIWTDIGDAMTEYVSADESKSTYTLKSGRERAYGAYIEEAVYREDISCAELTVAVYDASASELSVAGRYYIDLRASEASSYGYVIMAFTAAE